MTPSWQTLVKTIFELVYQLKNDAVVHLKEDSLVLVAPFGRVSYNDRDLNEQQISGTLIENH